MTSLAVAAAAAATATARAIPSRAATLAPALATAAYSTTRSYGGLKDQDRIFTNLYGKHDFGIKGALQRVRGWLAVTDTFLSFWLYADPVLAAPPFAACGRIRATGTKPRKSC